MKQRIENLNRLCKSMKRNYPTLEMKQLYLKYINQTTILLKHKFAEKMFYLYIKLEKYHMQKTTRINISSQKSTNGVPSVDVPLSHIQQTIKYLHEKYPDFKKIHFSWDDTLIIGDPQVGKSVFLFGCSIIKLLEDKPTVLVVRKYIQDATGMISKFNRFVDELNKHMKDFFTDFPTLEIVYNDDIKSKTTDSGIEYLENADKTIDALLSNRKKLLVVLSTGLQMERVNRIIYEHDIHPVVITDESDTIAYGAVTAADKGKTVEYEKLIAQSFQRIESTATPMDDFVGNLTLKNSQIIKVTPSKSYKDFYSLDKIELKHKITSWEVGESIYSNDLNLQQFLEDISNFPIFDKNIYDCGVDHPVICLMKTSTLKNHHIEFLTEFKRNPNLKLKWVVVTEYSSNTTMYANCLKGQTITIGTTTVTDDTNSGTFVFINKPISMPQILQWLFDNGGASKFSHIMIKSGHFSGRSRSYVSDNGYWHLTHQYYDGAGSLPSLIQDLRILNDRPNKIFGRLYLHTEDIERLIKSYKFLQESIHRLITLNHEVNTSEQIKNEVWNKGKIPPKTKLCCGSTNSKFKSNKTSGDDGGFDVQEYTNDISKYISDYNSKSKSKNETKNKGDELRVVINDDKLPKELKRVYDETCNAIMNCGLGIWYTRAEIVKQILPELHPKTEQNIQGHLCKIYQFKCRTTDVTETTEGFLMKKENNEVYLRIN